MRTLRLFINIKNSENSPGVTLTSVKKQMFAGGQTVSLV